MEQRRRLLRAIGVATLLVGLLAVAALAAGGRAPLDGDGAKGRGPPIVFWDYVFSTAVVLFVLAIPVVAWMFWVSRLSSQRRRTGQRRDLLVLAYVATLCARTAPDLRSWFPHPVDRPEPVVGRALAVKTHAGRDAIVDGA